MPLTQIENIIPVEAGMRRWFPFLLSVVIYLIVHEGLHAATAALFHEFGTIHIGPFPQVHYMTPVVERVGAHWALVSGASNVVTILLGYVLLLLGERLTRVRSLFPRSVFFYTTCIFLLTDPFNLSIGPFVYGGDADGIAFGLHLNRHVLQAVFLVVLLVNRELVAQKLFAIYGVQVKHILFRPLLSRAKKTRAESR